MSIPTVSIIVPVYNSEKYLRMMIESVLKQTFTDFELILVDDGSTDSSAAIVDDYSTKDERVKAIHKHNGGVSDARNCGIEYARGRFIAFWDSDDYIFPNSIEVMMKEIRDFDLLITSPVYSPRDKVERLPRKDTIVTVIEGKNEQMGEVFPLVDMSELAMVWAMFFRKSLIEDNNIRFRKIQSEDTLFCYEYIFHCKSIKHVDFSGYCYIHNSGSLTSSHKCVAEMDWIEKRYNLYQEIWHKFHVDVENNQQYKDAVFNRFAIRLSAFLLKGYHRDTRVSRKERLNRWKQVAKSEVFKGIKSVKINRKSLFFLSLIKMNLYVLADPFLLILTNVKER